ncbi:MAG: class I SAM-dependent methyltransferase [Anaerolineales bacterium]
MQKKITGGWFFPRYIGVVYIEPVMREIKSIARGRMLDLGCGTRRYEVIFREFVDSYIGLDWPEIKGRAFPDVIGDAMNIPFMDASVDVVLATELMEHLPSPQDFLTEVARVLRKNGVLILSVPFMEPIHEEPRDYYRFTPFSLRLLLEEHGFSLQRIWNKGGWWSVVLGSFVNQSLYDWSTSLDESGRRHYTLLTFVVLPVCALAQWLAYQLDRLFRSRRYTLGYILVAVRQ